MVFTPTGAATEQAAEEERFAGHHFSYGLFLCHDQAREDLLVPMRWVGVGAGIPVAWSFVGDFWTFSAEIRLSLSYLEERYGNGGAIATPALLFEGTGRIWERGSLSFDLGAVLRFRINDQGLFSWDDAHLYYLASHMLGPTAVLEWDCLTKSVPYLRLSLPLIGFAGRPEEDRFIKQELGSLGVFFTEPNSNLKFATLPSYFSFELSVGIARLLRRSTLRLEYVLDYERYSKPQPFTRLTNTIVFVHDIKPGRQ
jgi:hypothetical protein